jgi:hypothetical protein
MWGFEKSFYPSPLRSRQALTPSHKGEGNFPSWMEGVKGEVTKCTRIYVVYYKSQKLVFCQLLFCLVDFFRVGILVDQFSENFFCFLFLIGF